MKQIECVLLWLLVLCVLAYVYHTTKTLSSFASTTSTTVTIDSVPDNATGDAILAAITAKKNPYGFPLKVKYDVRKGPQPNGKWDKKKDVVNSFPLALFNEVYVLSLYVDNGPERVPFPLVDLSAQTLTRLKNVIVDLTTKNKTTVIDVMNKFPPTDPNVFKVITYTGKFNSRMDGYTPNDFVADSSLYRTIDSSVFEYNAEVIAKFAKNFVPGSGDTSEIPMESEYLEGFPKYHWRFLLIEPTSDAGVMPELTKIRIVFDNGQVPLRSGESDIRLQPSDWWPGSGKNSIKDLMTSKDYTISLPPMPNPMPSYSPPPGFGRKTVGIYFYYPKPREESGKSVDQKNVNPSLWNPNGDYMKSKDLDAVIAAGSKAFNALVSGQYKLVDGANTFAVWAMGIKDYPCVGGAMPYSPPLKKDYPQIFQDRGRLVEILNSIEDLPENKSLIERAQNDIDINMSQLIQYSKEILKSVKAYNDKSGVHFAEVGGMNIENQQFLSLRTGLPTGEPVYISPFINGYGMLRIVTFEPNTLTSGNPRIRSEKYYKIPSPGAQQSQFIKAALIQARLITTTALNTDGYRDELIEPEESQYIPPSNNEMPSDFTPVKINRSSGTNPLYNFDTLGDKYRCAGYKDDDTYTYNSIGQTVRKTGASYELVEGARGGLYCFPKNSNPGMPAYYTDFVRDFEGRPVLNLDSGGQVVANTRLGYYCPTWVNFEGNTEYIPGCPIFPNSSELIFWNTKFSQKGKGGYPKGSMAVQGTVQTLLRGGVSTQINNTDGVPVNSIPDVGYQVGDVIQLPNLNIDPNWLITRWYYPSKTLYPGRNDDFLTPATAPNAKPFLVNVAASEIDLNPSTVYQKGTKVNAKFKGSLKKFEAIIVRMPSSANNTYDLQYTVDDDLPLYINITARIFSRSFGRDFGTITGTLGILDNTFLVTSVNYQMPDRSRNMTVYHWSDIQDQAKQGSINETFVERRDYGPGSLATGTSFALPTKELLSNLKMLSIFAPASASFQTANGQAIPSSQVPWFGGNNGVLRFVQFDPSNGDIIDDFTVQNTTNRTTNNDVIEVRANLNTFMIRDTDVFVFDLNNLLQPSPTIVKWDRLNYSSKRPISIPRFQVGDRVEVISQYTDQYGGAQYVSATIEKVLDANIGKFKVRYDTSLPRGVSADMLLDPNDIYFTNMRFPRDASMGVVASYSAHQSPGFDNRFNAINNDDELMKYGVKIVDLDNFANSLYTIEYVMRGNHPYTNRITSVVTRMDGRVFGNFDANLVELDVPASYIQMIDSTGSNVASNVWRERYGVRAKLVLREKKDVIVTKKPSKRFYSATIVAVNPDGTFDVKYNLGATLLRRRRQVFNSQFSVPVGSTDFWKYSSTTSTGTANTDFDKYVQRPIRNEFNFVTNASVPATPVGLTPTDATNPANSTGRLVFNGWNTKVLSNGLPAPGLPVYTDVEVCEDWTMNSFDINSSTPSRYITVNNRRIPIYTVYGNFIPEADIITDCSTVRDN